MSLQAVPALFGVIGLAAALVICMMIAKQSVSDGKVASIGNQIHIGAMAFMKREYTILFGFVAVLAVLIAISDLGVHTMIAFLLGAICSAFLIPC